jgi:hypothetical protein
MPLTLLVLMPGRHAGVVVPEPTGQAMASNAQYHTLTGQATCSSCCTAGPHIYGTQPAADHGLLAKHTRVPGNTPQAPASNKC